MRIADTNVEEHALPFSDDLVLRHGSEQRRLFHQRRKDVQC